MPTLVIRGNEDPVADRLGSLDHFDELTVPSDYVEISGLDHYPMHGDRRRAFFAAVADFQGRV